MLRVLFLLIFIPSISFAQNIKSLSYPELIKTYEAETGQVTENTFIYEDANSTSTIVDSLMKGDVIVVLFSKNDFFGIVRPGKSFSGYVNKAAINTNSQIEATKAENKLSENEWRKQSLDELREIKESNETLKNIAVFSLIASLASAAITLLSLL